MPTPTFSNIDGTDYSIHQFTVNGSGDGAELVNHELKPGEGVIVNNSSESGVTVQSAGQVPGAIERDVGVFQIIGNGSPVALLNQKMTITGSGDGATMMQILDDEGSVEKKAYWYNDGGSPEYPAGWWDADGAELVDIILQPGDAVILNNSSETGVKVRIPAAL